MAIHSFRSFLRRFARPFLRPIFRVLFRVRVEGEIPPVWPERLLVVANHESFLDGPLLGLFLPLDPVYVIHTDIARSWYFRILLSVVDYLVVDPANPMAMKQVIHLIRSGRPVVIFPEGRITLTGSLMKVYDGPALVAAKTGAAILPVRLDGTARSYFARLSGRNPKRVFPRITLTLLPLTSLPQPHGDSSRQRRFHEGEALRRLMQEMLFASRPRLTLFGAFCRTMDIHGRRRKVVEDQQGANLSYQGLLKMSLMLGRLLARRTAPGERVGVLLPNVAPTLGLFLGLPAMGRVPAMLNYSAGREGLQVACQAAAIRLVVTSRRFLAAAHLEETAAALTGVSFLYLEDLRQELRWNDLPWLYGFALWWPRCAVSRAQGEDPAVVLFTSGSEGRPKGVELSHRALLANIAQIRSVYDVSVDDHFLNALPLFHSLGLTAGGLLPLLAGCRVFLYPSPLHYRVIPELAYDRGCTVLLGTSTFLGHYAKFAHPYDFYRLRYVVAGGERLTEPVRQLWIDKFGLRIMEGYGTTETAPVIAVNSPMAYRRGSVGQPLPGIKVRLLPVPGIDQGGRLQVSGPNVMSGYLRAEAPGQLEPPVSPAGPGWYDTGDIAELDEDGFVFIRGRVKRFAKVAGEMVSLDRAEALAAAAAPQALHAVLAEEVPGRGEALVLYTTDPNLSREGLTAAARAGGFPEIAIPRRLVWRESLPLMATGKVDYVTLARQAGAAAPVPAVPDTASEPVAV